MAEPANAPIRTDDPGGAGLQTQIDDLRLALQDWRKTREYSQPTLERLAQITVQCARMVESWQQIEERRAPALPGTDERAGDRATAEDRLDHGSGDRIRALERTIEHEWKALREGGDESAGQLREQAVSLAESCVAVANLTMRGFARTEARLAALEQDLQGSMAQLSRDLQSVVTELRSARPRPSPSNAAAFPLESVMRIHEEMRSETGAAPGADALKAGATRALPQSTDSATALTARMDSLERAVTTAATPPRPAGRWLPYVVITLLAVVAGIAGFNLWTQQRRVETRLNEAAVRVSDAERQSAATREQAAKEVADARQSAARAQNVSNVLAAPDLVRYWLIGAGTEGSPRAYAQVLFSRSRGMVFSASRLPPPGAGKTYQLWLLTKDGAVSGGVLTPDSAGLVTLSTDGPLTVPGRVTDALVTLEAEGGAAQPSADKVLTRVVE